MKDLENYKNKIKFNGEQLEKCKGIIEQLEKQIQNCALKERDNENLKNENSFMNFNSQNNKHFYSFSNDLG